MHDNTPPRSSTTTRRLAWIATLLTTGCLDTRMDGAAPTPTPLARLSVDVACESPGAPTHRARHCERVASMRTASYPFAADEGPRALRLLSEAAACHAAAGAEQAAARATAQRDRFARRLDDDYRVLRLRLSLSLAQERTADARSAVHALLSLLESAPPDPYIIWLRQLARRLP